jgi:hypothetical protein
MRERLMKEIKNLVYVAIQIKSHEVESGYKEPHIPGQPCSEKICPKCGSRMKRI